MEFPNKTYIADFITNGFNDEPIRRVILVAAKNSDTASAYLKDKLGINPVLIYLMGCNYPTIYDRTGVQVEPIQAKILYNKTM